MEAAERTSKHECHQHTATSRDYDVSRLAKLEGADAPQKQIGSGEVESAPKHVHRRGRKTLTRRGGERALKRAPRNAVYEMRQCVDEERATEEIRNVVIPAHRVLPGSYRSRGFASAALYTKSGAPPTCVVRWD